jgi:hypothetical protein
VVMGDHPETVATETRAGTPQRCGFIGRNAPNIAELTSDVRSIAR